MLKQGDNILVYDGSYEGFLCCVYSVFKSGYLPLQIHSADQAVESLFAETYIETQLNLSQRVQSRLRKRLSADQYRFIQDGFLTNYAEKDRCLLEAIDIALTYSEPFTNFLGKSAIRELQQAIKTLRNEIHHYKGFVRFERVNAETLYSVIEPKCQVLPNLLTHFKNRYPLQTIVIYDRTHQLLAWTNQQESTIMPVSEPPKWQSDEIEQKIQQQWITFFQTVSIRERENARQQNSMLPKRFRAQMVEFQDKKQQQHKPNMIKLEKSD